MSQQTIPTILAEQARHDLAGAKLDRFLRLSRVLAPRSDAPSGATRQHAAE